MLFLRFTPCETWSGGRMTTLLRYTCVRNDKMKTDCNPCLYLLCHYSTFGSWSSRGWFSFCLSKGVNTQHLPPLIFYFFNIFSCFTLGNMQIIEKRKEEKRKRWIYTIIKLERVPPWTTDPLFIHICIILAFRNSLPEHVHTRFVTVSGPIATSVSGSLASLGIVGTSSQKVWLSVIGRPLMNECVHRARSVTRSVYFVVISRPGFSPLYMTVPELVWWL